MTNHDKLLSYMLGWRKGAACSAFTDEQMAIPDFKLGWEHGRIAQQVSYEMAQKRYNASLSPLRLEEKATP